jgi:Tol biopolymer transport system component
MSAPSPTPAPSPTLASSTAGCADLFRASDGRIAFTITSGDGAAIAAIDADGSGFRQVVEPGPGRAQPHAGTEAPHWIPQERVLFSSNRAGGPDDWHLFVVGASGGEPSQLTDDPGGIEYHGVPSPDGSSLAYAKAVATGNPAEPWRDAGIFVSDADGGGERQLTKPPEGTLDEWPDISPDGTMVAFSRGLGGAPGSARGSVYVVNLDGTGLRQITDPELDAIRPRWSPDGRLIAFSSNADNHMSESANTWVVAPDGTGIRQLTFRSGMSQAFYPDWSPDGRNIVFLDHRVGSGTQDLATITLEGDTGCTLWRGTSSRLAGDPDWGPSGG